VSIDDAWQGSVQFYELVFGTWLIYVFLVLLWERILGERLQEWRYAMITFLGASFFWVNHYFQHAPFYLLLLNGYALVFWITYWNLTVRGRQRSLSWKTVATLTAVLFTVAFILFEQLARLGVKSYGLHEFDFMAISYFGFIGLILWRERALRLNGPATR
jgi:hypothetical protein